MQVDHRTPIHDQFCRCTACKPCPRPDGIGRGFLVSFGPSLLLWLVILAAVIALVPQHG